MLSLQGCQPVWAARRPAEQAYKTTADEARSSALLELTLPSKPSWGPGPGPQAITHLHCLLHEAQPTCQLLKGLLTSCSVSKRWLPDSSSISQPPGKPSLSSHKKAQVPQGIPKIISQVKQPSLHPTELLPAGRSKNHQCWLSK